MTRELQGWRLGWLAALVGACCASLASPLGAAEVMPPAPPRYFNDFAGVTRPDTQARLNKTLEQFEKDTSSQIVVAVFPKMETDSSIEDYVNRMFKAWKIGQQQKNNGVLLAVFVQAALGVAVSIAAALVSYHLFEKRFLVLKLKYETPKPASVAAPAPDSAPAVVRGSG